MKSLMPVMFGLMLIVSTQSAQADPVTYTGRVTSADGKPVSGVSVDAHWSSGSKGMTPLDKVSTDADGRFKIVVESLRRPITLMAITADQKLGGRVVADPKKQTDGFEIKLVPLVRVHGGYSCPMPDHPVEYGDVLVMAGEHGWEKDALPAEVARTESFLNDDLKPGEKPKPSTFDLKLPPGQYYFNFFESTEPDEHEQTTLSLTIKADQPGLDLDLGAIELKPSKLSEGYGKPAPPLQIKDARGLAKDVKLADFKGKWVILEFWSWGCGPCISMGLPNMVDFIEEHAVDRDKFVILALHDDSADDFAELDKKLASTIKNLWHGKPLPFPILLDDDGKTFEAYGISAIPATVLINPEGKLVRLDLEELEAKLTPTPMDRQIARALDRQVVMTVDTDGGPLDAILDTLDSGLRFKITIDEASGASPKAIVPLTIAGRLSLKSWLNLTLEPLNLVAVPGPEGLIVKKAGPDHRADLTVSATQCEATERIAAKLQARTSFHFEKATLAEVAAFFEKATEENFVVDPIDRKAGRLDLKTTISGQATDVSLKDGLKLLLDPIGVEAVIRDEVVILRRFRP